MGMNVCLFCNESEESYKPSKDIDFVCSRCVLILANASQEDLKKAYQKALYGGYLRKVSALESFIIPEEKYGKRSTKSVKRNINRERTARSIRNQKRLSQPIEA
jgi:hypothetical protein